MVNLEPTPLCRGLSLVAVCMLALCEKPEATNWHPLRFEVLGFIVYTASWGLLFRVVLGKTELTINNSMNFRRLGVFYPKI